MPFNCGKSAADIHTGIITTSSGHAGDHYGGYVGEEPQMMVTVSAATNRAAGKVAIVLQSDVRLHGSSTENRAEMNNCAMPMTMTMAKAVLRVPAPQRATRGQRFTSKNRIALKLKKNAHGTVYPAPGSLDQDRAIYRRKLHD